MSTDLHACDEAEPTRAVERQPADVRAVLQQAADLIDRAVELAPGDWQGYFTVHGDPCIADISTASRDYGRVDCVLIGASGPQHWRAVVALFRDVLQAHPDAGMLSAGYCGTCAVPTSRCATLAAVLPLARHTTASLTGQQAPPPTTPQENR